MEGFSLFTAAEIGIISFDLDTLFSIQLEQMMFHCVQTFLNDSTAATYTSGALFEQLTLWVELAQLNNWVEHLSKTCTSRRRSSFTVQEVGTTPYLSDHHIIQETNELG